MVKPIKYQPEKRPLSRVRTPGQNEFDIVFLKGITSVKGTILGDSVLRVGVHWGSPGEGINPSEQPCLRPCRCRWCITHPKVTGVGFIAFESHTHGGLRVLKMPDAPVLDLEGLREERGSLRGLYVELGRLNNQPNGRVLIADHRWRDASAVPESFDIKPVIRRFWRGKHLPPLLVPDDARQGPADDDIPPSDDTVIPFPHERTARPAQERHG